MKMTEPKTYVLGAHIPTTVSTRKTLTYVNGIYTVKTSNVPIGSASSVEMVKCEPTQDASPGSSTDKSYPVLISTRSSHCKAITNAPIPSSVLEIREELNRVQSDLKRKLQGHAVAQHKVQLLNKGALKDGEDGERFKMECRSFEGEISELKARQNMLIEAVRDALVVVGNKLPKSKVKKSDISQNVNIYNHSRPKPQPPAQRPAKKAKLSPPVSLLSANPVTSSPPSTAIVGFVLPSQSTNPPPLQGPAVHVSTALKTSTSTESSQSSPKTEPMVAVVQSVTPTTAPSVASTSSSQDAVQPDAMAGEDDDIEIVEVTCPQAKRSKSYSKPQLLPKPMSVSPVPPPLDESHARYSSVQEAHLQAIQKASSEIPDEPKDKELLDFMTSLDLVTPQALESLQRRKTERRTMTRSRFERLTGKRPNEYLNSLSSSMASKRPRRSTASSPVIPAAPPLTRGRRATPPPITGNLSEDDGSLHEDFCGVCSKSGELLMCDTCTQVFHLHCIGLQHIPDGKWSCAKCVAADRMNVNQANSVDSSKPVSAMMAVHQFVKQKAVKDEQRMKLLERNTELMDKSRELKNVLDDLKKKVDDSLAENDKLKVKNQQTRSLLQKMMGVYRSIKRSYK